MSLGDDMEFWFRKILVSLTIYFGVTGICFADGNQDLNWHKAHYQELKQSVQEYIQNNSLYPLLEQAPFELYLAKEPNQMYKGDNFYLTTIIGNIEQGETDLLAFFCVYHQINPSWAQTLFMYTANDELHMPSVKLLLDVKNHTFMQQKKYLKTIIYILSLQMQIVKGTIPKIGYFSMKMKVKQSL